MRRLRKLLHARRELPFRRIADGYDSHEICGICGWEDDDVQLANPTSWSGANRGSLAEVQAEILARLPLDVVKHGELRRDPRWRPLDALELADSNTTRALRHWHTAPPQARIDVCRVAIA